MEWSQPTLPICVISTPLKWKFLIMKHGDYSQHQLQFRKPSFLKNRQPTHDQERVGDCETSHTQQTQLLQAAILFNVDSYTRTVCINVKLLVVCFIPHCSYESRAVVSPWDKRLLTCSPRESSSSPLWFRNTPPPVSSTGR